MSTLRNSAHVITHVAALMYVHIWFLFAVLSQVAFVKFFSVAPLRHMHNYFADTLAWLTRTLAMNVLWPRLDATRSRRTPLMSVRHDALLLVSSLVTAVHRWAYRHHVWHIDDLTYERDMFGNFLPRQRVFSQVELSQARQAHISARLRAFTSTRAVSSRVRR